ncbi:Holliday junction branch migration protein RuvA [bacterium]|nr:Holliday junction branch migration protein RuvA [bacterium]
MIEFLHGQLLARNGNHLVVGVGGVGYGVTVTAQTAENAANNGEVRLWVRTYVREDALRLFGFAQIYERAAFDEIMEVPGVGPALALTLLSSLSVGEIIQAAMLGDVARFKKIKGIGQKMAEKLVLELKGRAEKLAAELPAEARTETVNEPGPTGEAARDAVAALEALDVKPAQARRAIMLAIEAIGNDATVEQLVREGLKYRRQGA